MNRTILRGRIFLGAVLHVFRLPPPAARNTQSNRVGGCHSNTVYTILYSSKTLLGGERVKGAVRSLLSLSKKPSSFSPSAKSFCRFYVARDLNRKRLNLSALREVNSRRALFAHRLGDAGCPSFLSKNMGFRQPPIQILLGKPAVGKTEAVGGNMVPRMKTYCGFILNFDKHRE